MKIIQERFGVFFAGNFARRTKRGGPPHSNPLGSGGVLGFFSWGGGGVLGGWGGGGGGGCGGGVMERKNFRQVLDAAAHRPFGMINLYR